MSQIYTISISNSKDIRVDKKEVLRYLRVAKSDLNVDLLIDECLCDAYEIISPRAVVLETSVEILSECSTKLDFVTMESCSLATTLTGYKRAYIFLATIGTQLDRVIEKYSKLSPSKATVYHAVGTALIESFCDYVNDLLTKDKNSTRRFSPGYGDLSLEYQRDIIKALDAQRKIGVVLAESLLMTPSKTVTAIIGIK